MDAAHLVANAQLSRALRHAAPVPLLERLVSATRPEQVQQAVRNSLPAMMARAFGDADLTDPAALRRTHAEELGISAADLAFRELYPGLDEGIYACSHSMGVPSIAGPAAVLDQLGQLATNGILVWDEGLWVDVMDRYRERCAELVGGNLRDGDVTWFPNVSEALSAVLECIPGGALVYTAGHFTTGHYVHHAWARQTGGTLVEVPTEADGSVPTERIVAALTPDVRVVSISHALFESGWLQDLPAIAAAVREKCPDALLLVDAYQTAGSVPIDAAALGDHVAVTAGGHKQLRSSAGAAFLYVPRRWLPHWSPTRTGWWNHADPFAFEKGPVRRAQDGTIFRTGTPTVVGMAMLIGELAALATSTDGILHDALGRARRVTSTLVARGIERAQARGLDVRGEWGAERRAAFLCVRSPRGRTINDALARRGFRVDFRPAAPQSNAGILRVSGNAAGFAYEIDATIDAIAGLASA